MSSEYEDMKKELLKDPKLAYEYGLLTGAEKERQRILDALPEEKTMDNTPRATSESRAIAIGSEMRGYNQALAEVKNIITGEKGE